MTAFEALLAASAATGWPTSFRTDLTMHDRAWLERRTDLRGKVEPFAWAVGAAGTHAVNPGVPLR